MTRTTYFTASSLDGFIADPEHSLDWLLSRDVDQGGPMGYDAFIAQVGALAMGASIYRWLQDRGDDWPYAMPAWVFTHRDLAPIGDGDIRFTTDDVADVHAQMVEAAQGKDVWLVGGGDLVGQFADRGLLDEVLVSFAPVTLGSGAPLLPRRLELRLTDLARNRDFACARYAVVRPSQNGQGAATVER